MSAVRELLQELDSRGDVSRLLGENIKTTVVTDQRLREKYAHWLAITYHKDPAVIDTVLKSWQLMQTDMSAQMGSLTP